MQTRVLPVIKGVTRGPTTDELHERALVVRLVMTCGHATANELSLVFCTTLNVDIKVRI